VTQRHFERHGASRGLSAAAEFLVTVSDRYVVRSAIEIGVSVRPSVCL